MDNFITIEFPALSENEAFSRIAVAAFSLSLDPTTSELADIKTAVSEAVTNSVVHGYGEGEGRVILKMKADKNTLTFIIEDFGVGIEDIQKAMQPLYTTGTSPERSGMGFTVMQSFMDSLKVESAPGKGTRVTMTKKIS